MANFVGTAGHDHLFSVWDFDVFDISQGGRDTVVAGGLDDTILAGAAFDSKDRIDGGEQLDVLVLEGDYSGGVAITDLNLVNVEQVRLAGGHDYALALLGLSPEWTERFEVQGGYLHAGDALVVDASAITATPLYFSSGAGDDTFIGGALGDRFSLATSGVDRAAGGGGDDIFELGLPFNPGAGVAEATVDGGAGDDTVYLRTGSLEGLDLEGGTGLDVLILEGAPGSPVVLDGRVTGFEAIEVNDLFSGAIRSADSLVAAGASIVIRSDYFGELVFDGSRETDGRFEIRGGGNDFVRGGAQDDLFTQSWGPDTLLGGDGDDRILVDNYQIDALSRYDGGRGDDVLEITDSHMSGDPFLFGANTFRNIETLVVAGVRQVVLHDGNVARGKVLEIQGRGVWGADVDASGETDGRLNFQGVDGPYDFNNPSGPDRFVGGASRDTLSGGGADDTLSGGGGGDKLIGGGTHDLLTGGGGIDVFIFRSVDDVATGSSRWDLITDLTKTDVIDLRGIDANELKDGNQAFTVVSAFTQKAGELTLAYDAATNLTTLLMDVDGDGAFDGKVQMTGDWDRFSNFVL